MNKDIKRYDNNGLKHGYWEMYHPNGQLWLRGSYIHGRRCGLHESYYSDGRIFYIKYYYLGKEIYQTSKNKLIW